MCLRRGLVLLAGFRPAGEVLFLATPDRRPKKSTQKKVALLLATLRLAKGNLCRGICGVCRETLYAP